MTGPKDPPLQRGSGRVLMLGSLVLAVSAAVVLALGAQDAGLLRLGIVAALWAALIGTLAAVRMRREISAGADRAEDLHTIYRMELDREIAARREHELTVERELREQVEQREREEITALRGELQSLRETLRNLMGGDVLVERVALRAESTRLLPMPEPSGVVAEGRSSSGGTAGVPRSLGSAQSPARRADREPWEVRHRPDPPARRPEPVDAPARPAAESRPRRDAGARPAAGDAEPDIFSSTAAELAGRSAPADRPWNPAVAPHWQPAVPSEQQAARRQRNGSPSQPPPPQPPPPQPMPPASRPAAPPPAASPPAAPPPAAPRGATPPAPAGANSFLDQDPLGAISRPGVGGGRHSGSRHGSHGNGAHSNHNGAHSNGAHSNGNGVHSNHNGAHSNGAHSNHNGAHSNGNGAHSTNGADGTGRRRASEQAPTGKPAGGRPVDELLAAYGEGSAPRHRRRRAAD